MSGILVIGDTHVGSTVGLCPPHVQLEDGGWYTANAVQQFLRKAWLSCLDEAWELTKSDDHRVLILMGDITEGWHHGTTQVMSTNRSLQVSWSLEVLKDVLHIGFDEIYVVKGTKAHVGPGAALESGIASALEAEGYPLVRCAKTDSPSHYYLFKEWDGVRIEAAHHGRMGTRPWTETNVVNNYAAEIFYRSAEYSARTEKNTGKPQVLKHPHIALRAHQHRFADTFNAHPTRLIATPSFQAPTEFIHRIAPGVISDVGMVYIKTEDSRYEVEPILRTPKRPGA